MNKLQIHVEASLIEEATDEIFAWSARIRKYMLVILIIGIVGPATAGMCAVLAHSVMDDPGGIYITGLVIMLFTGGASIALSSILRISSNTKVRVTSGVLEMVDELFSAMSRGDKVFVPTRNYIRCRTDAILALSLKYPISPSLEPIALSEDPDKQK